MHFRGAPMVWMGLSAGWMLITLALVLVPVIGGVAANLLQPVFFASFAMTARKQLAGEAPEMGDLFLGFRRPLRPLINLGALPWGLGLLVVIPVMVASTYTGYAEVFEETGEAPAPATPE